MSDELLLGFDVGTSTLKAATFDLDGEPIGVTSVEIPLAMPAEGICEVDPRAYWQGMQECCSQLARVGVELSAVRALAVAAHAETLIPVDERLEPVRPAIVWMDTRSTDEAAELAARFGVAAIAEHSGQPVTIPMWPATKLLWLRRHEPDLARTVRWWLQPLDYLVARLTGLVVSDGSEYSSSLLLDIRNRGWWQAMLEELTVEPSSLPELQPAGTAVARLRAAAAEELGLSPDVLVVMGGFDQACTALGAGNVRQGIVSESTGMSLAVVATVEQPPPAGAMVPCHIHVVRDRFFLCAHNPTGGSAYAWVRSRFAPELSYAELDQRAASVEPGSEGLVLLPTLAGTATPTYDPNARGVLAGLTLRHDVPHIARAALEGIAFTLAQLLAEERRLGARPVELRSVGGGSGSPLWAQIKADVTGLPVRVPRDANHAGALGAAILAGVGLGAFSSIEDGAEATVRIERSYEPDRSRGQRYEQSRLLHERLYPRLADLFALETA